MENLIEIIGKSYQNMSKYEVLNNLIPGAVLCYLLYFIGFSVLSSNWWYNIVLFYIVGLINGRFSSLVIEGVCKKTKFVKTRSYNQYNAAKEKNPFVSTLQESANMYRALASAFIITLLAKFCKWATDSWTWFNENMDWIIILCLVILFLLSYRKQVNEYVVKAIDESSESQSEK